MWLQCNGSNVEIKDRLGFIFTYSGVNSSVMMFRVLCRYLYCGVDIWGRRVFGFVSLCFVRRGRGFV